MRGKLQRVRRDGHSPRIIPARAGQTLPWPPFAPLAPDHPRACGANFHAIHLVEPLFGSSPRVRGKQRRDHITTVIRRIIPARAGQTIPSLRIRGKEPDHPRACGANTSMSASPLRVIGSSPRVRGKPRAGMRPRLAHRIIPARAGQTCRPSRNGTGRTDHPRACGANQAAGLNAGILGGSSPRVRGKRVDEFENLPPVRIIPARAGQTPESPP